MKTTHLFIRTAVIVALSSTTLLNAAKAQSVQDIQFELLSRAESYCTDLVGKKSPQFNTCVNNAYDVGWKRYKEGVELQLAQNRAVEDAQRQAKLDKERREAQGWAMIAQSAQMAAPVRYGTNCTTRNMAGTLQTQCF